LEGRLFSDPDEEFVAGYIMNKLYFHKYFGRKGNKSHNKHTEIINAGKGLPPEYRGKINKVCRKMAGVTVLLFKATGEDHICALVEKEAMAIGLPLANRYREAVGLHPLNEFLVEIEDEPSVSKPASYTRLTDKERRSKEYYEKKIRKWADDKGLS
jgi:hypothetical protein